MLASHAGAAPCRQYFRSDPHSPTIILGIRLSHGQRSKSLTIGIQTPYRTRMYTVFTSRRMSPTRIIELARIIVDSTQTVDEYFTARNIASPSFGIHGSSTIIIQPEVPEVAVAHAAVIDATKELHSLMLGPTALLMNNGVCSLHCSKL